MRHLAFSLERAARAMRAPADRGGAVEEENGDGGGGGGGGAGGVGGAVVERLVVFISLEDFSMWTAPNLATTRETIDMVPQPHSYALDVQIFYIWMPNCFVIQ